MNLPEKLYKYESFSVQSIRNLKNQVIYFAAPSGFNDPFDCALKAELSEPTATEIEYLRDIYLTKNWPLHVLEKIKTAPLEQLKPMLVRAARHANEQVFDSFLKDKGVSCFSEVNDELLMWGHYAEKYKGFCLEFATNNELFEKAKKVNYVNEIPKLDIRSVYVDEERDNILELFCTKSKAWEYEKEWRVFHAVSGTAYTYPSEALTGVYFGPKMPTDIIEIICLILKGQNQHVKFWKGKQSEFTFKVEFDEVAYISSLEAMHLASS